MYHSSLQTQVPSIQTCATILGGFIASCLHMREASPGSAWNPKSPACSPVPSEYMWGFLREKEGPWMGATLSFTSPPPLFFFFFSETGTWPGLKCKEERERKGKKRSGRKRGRKERRRGREGGSRRQRRVKRNGYYT